MEMRISGVENPVEGLQMLERIAVKTRSSCDFIDITADIKELIDKSGVIDGICVVFVTHTTAGVTINENADPDVTRDILCGLEKMVPNRGDYRHAEGNSPAHIKTSMVGPSLTMIIEGGAPILGTWQSVFFCEFDGPRTRSVCVKIIEG